MFSKKKKIPDSIFRQAVTSAFNHIVITDTEGKIIFANEAVTKITGYNQEEVIGERPSLWGKQMPKKFYTKMWDTIKNKQEVFKGELINKRKNGEKYIAESIISPIFDNRHNLIGFIGTEQDITREKEVDQMKSEFISIAAHQLKTPLTSIRWSLELLMKKQKKTLKKEERETLNNLNTSTNKLSKLVNLLLNVSRIESGRLITEPKLISIEEIVKEIIKEMKPLLEHKNQKIVTNFQKIKKLKYDPDFVRQVFHNLISNASKYSPEKTKITVTIEKKSTYLQCSIKDEGYGIPKDEQKNIFGKFYRATNIRKKPIEGNGLGLYFIKRIIDEWKGKIWFETEENKGTTFLFTLPMKGMKKKDGQVKLS